MQSKRFSIAVHILVALALRRERLSSEQLAWSTGTNASMVRRIVGMLARAGLIRSHSGQAGGFELARPPGSINLLEVLQAVELKPATGLHDPNPECPLGAVIVEPVEQVLRRADQASEEVLARTTLETAARAVGRRMTQG